MVSNTYMLWGNFRVTPQEESEFAIQHYIKKYGTPPEILLHNEKEPIEPIEGFHHVIDVAPYVPVGAFLIGMKEGKEN